MPFFVFAEAPLRRDCQHICLSIERVHPAKATPGRTRNGGRDAGDPGRGRRGGGGRAETLRHPARWPGGGGGDLSNGTLTARIITWGAALRCLDVPDRDGRRRTCSSAMPTWAPISTTRNISGRASGATPTASGADASPSTGATTRCPPMTGRTPSMAGRTGSTAAVAGPVRGGRHHALRDPALRQPRRRGRLPRHADGERHLHARGARHVADRLQRDDRQADHRQPDEPQLLQPRGGGVRPPGARPRRHDPAERTRYPSTRRRSRPGSSRRSRARRSISASRGASARASATAARSSCCAGTATTTTT